MLTDALIFGLLAVAVWFLVKGLFFGKKKSAPKPSAPSDSNDSREMLARFGIGFRRKSQRVYEPEKPQMEINPENRRALDLLEKNDFNIFLTGKAGTGKSTLLRYFRATTKKNIAVVAPTGVASINVQGQTIHRFFRFKPDITVDKIPKYLTREGELYKKLDALVIDEISMVRADLLDCVDAFLRLHGPKPGKPFGGVQIITIGDLYQLPPVVRDEEEEIFQTYYKSQFFFAARGLVQAPLVPFELTKIYRQTDPEFIEILNDIREGRADEQHLRKVNERVNTDYDFTSEDGQVRIWLVPTKVQVAEINGWHMEHLEGKERTYKGFTEGRFEEREMPTDLELKLKIGSQVMLLNNDSKGKWVNGDMAKVIDFGDESVRVMFEDGTFADVNQHTWDSFRHALDPDTGRIVAVSDGSYTQFPIKPAWALTIHKSQGKTYDRVVIDFGRGTFAAGQAYVALSRCRSLEGLILKTPLKASHVFIDEDVQRFMEAVRQTTEKMKTAQA